MHAVLTGAPKDAVATAKILDVSPADGVFRAKGGRRRTGHIAALLLVPPIRFHDLRHGAATMLQLQERR